MGKHDEPRIEGLAEFRRQAAADGRRVVEVVVEAGAPSPVIVVTCEGKPWAALIRPTDESDYLNVDVHAFSGDAAHKARVIGFPYGTGVRLPNEHEYPLTAVIIGEDD